MVHSERKWRAHVATIPSGTDAGEVYSLLTAPENSHLVLTSIATWGAQSGTIYPNWWLIPPGTMTSDPYTINAAEPVYACGIGLGLSGAQNGAITQFGLQIAIRDCHPQAPFIIPQGWTLGVSVHDTSDAVSYCSAVGVVANAT